MIHIHEKTLKDVEFYTVLQQVSELCITDLGRVESLEIKPLTTKENVLQSLDYTNEYVSSFIMTIEFQITDLNPLQKRSSF